MPELSREDIAAICDEMERRQAARSTAEAPAAPTPPPAARPAFIIKNSQGLEQNTTHTKGGACPSCQAGYPLDLNDPPMITVGFKEPDVVPQHELGKHFDPPAPEPILERDPRYPVDEHAQTCGGLLHGVLLADSLTEHSVLEICERSGCNYSNIRRFEHALT